MSGCTFRVQIMLCTAGKGGSVSKARRPEFIFLAFVTLVTHGLMDRKPFGLCDV
jgi:hypothetical protein